MLKDITLGQFYPANSPLHRLDARTKLLTLIMYITALFMVQGWAGYIAVIGLLVCAMAMSRVPLGMYLRSVRPLIFIIILTSALNILYTTGDVVWTWWVITVTRQGLLSAAFMVIRITALVMATAMLTYTTSPIMLTDAIERLLSPLKVIKVPAHELAMMMTIALRFIPTLVEETDKIINAQKARGADFESGNIIRRAKAMIPILIPLFVSAFRRADDLAIAMECRCYNGGEGRTRLRVMRMGGNDAFAFLLLTVLIAGVVLLNIYFGAL